MPIHPFSTSIYASKTVTSYLDVDFYKHTMGDFVLKWYPNTKVKFAFKNRSKHIKLARVLDAKELQTVFDGMRNDLTFTNGDWLYLRDNCRVLSIQWLDHLEHLRLPKVVVGTTEDGDQLTIEVEGKWADVILWETMVLSTINELYYRATVSASDTEETCVEGEHRLWEKIRLIRSMNKLEGQEVKFMEFGTRRRFSRKWQEKVTSTLRTYLPGNLIGTSNVLLAKQLGLKPVGTMAHELLMVGTALVKPLVSPNTLTYIPNKIFESWHDHFDGKLSIALTDTFGSKAFFGSLTKDLANKLAGVRQDSGDAFEFAFEYLRVLESFGVDPKTKTIVFSDGLDLGLMFHLQTTFGSKINLVFGWGTNLTNDLGLEPLSIVMKAVEATNDEGLVIGTVKLSDNLEKATGKPEDIDYYKKAFGYTNTNSEKCVY